MKRELTSVLTTKEVTPYRTHGTFKTNKKAISVYVLYVREVPGLSLLNNATNAASLASVVKVKSRVPFIRRC
jgi:hypothetical protein